MTLHIQTRPLRRAALLQPGGGDEAAGGGADTGDLGRHLRGHDAVGQGHGEDLRQLPGDNCFIEVCNIFTRLRRGVLSYLQAFTMESILRLREFFAWL